MKKILTGLCILFLLVGCSNKNKTETTVCSFKSLDIIENTFEIEANKNDVTKMTETLKVTRDPKVNVVEFTTKTKTLVAAVDAQNSMFESKAGGKIPGYETKVTDTDDLFEFIKIQDFSKIDFDIMNKIQFYNGYDREVKGLFLDEEVEALEANGFTCTVQK